MKTSAFLKSLMKDYNLFFEKIVEEIKLVKNSKNDENQKKSSNYSLHLNKKFRMSNFSKVTTVLSLFFLLGISSCKKDLLEKDNNTPNVLIPSMFKDIKTSPDFNWNTHSKIKFSFIGVQTIEPIYGTLTVQLPNGSKLISLNHKLSDNLSVELTVPAHVKTLLATFGSNQKEIQIVGNSATFNYTDLFPAEPIEE